MPLFMFDAMDADSAIDLAERLAARSLTAEELVTTALERIDKARDLVAFVSVFRSSAIKAARRVDAARVKGKPVPFFAGVPLAIKDQSFIRFHTTRFGSRAGLAFPSPFDDAVVGRLRKAGFIFVGVTSMSEFGVIPVTENLLHAPARNPWNPDLTPGGSSGGSGAAVAAGLVPLAHGSDGGGSLRIPAAFCGLFTLKPTRGTLPNNHGADAQKSLYIDGPLATSPLDVAAALDVMLGGPGPAALYEAAQQAPRPLLVRLCTTNGATGTDPRLVAAATKVGEALARLGHRVEPTDPVDMTPAHFVPLWQRLVANTPGLRTSRAHPITAWLHREGKKLDRADVWKLHLEAQARIDAWFGQADLIVTPTTAVVAQPVGLGASSATPKEDFERFVPFAAYTAPFNVSGQPAASIPVGLTDDGLPLGVQLAGKRGADGLVLSVCHQLQLAGVAVRLESPMARDLRSASDRKGKALAG
jgi:amidase